MSGQCQKVPLLCRASGCMSDTAAGGSSPLYSLVHTTSLSKAWVASPGHSVPRPVPQPLRLPKNWYKGANAFLFWLHTSFLVLVSFLFAPSPAHIGSSAPLPFWSAPTVTHGDGPL